MPGYEPDGWHEFFIGSAGGVAALSGLIFVAVSVNLREIFAAEKEEGGRFLTGRAIEALVALLLVLGICIVGLTPEIELWVLGGFVLVAAAGSAVSPVRMLVAEHAANSHQKGGPARLAMAIVFFLVLLISGVSIIVQAGGGLYWLPAAFVIAITVAAINAWVLLVEVLR
jgi:hypothetical protein